MAAPTLKVKINIIRKDFVNGPSSSMKLAKSLDLNKCTINKYRNEFKEIRRLYPHQLANYKFRLPKEKYVRPIDPRRAEMIDMLPGLMDQCTAAQVQLKPLWDAYRLIHPKGLGRGVFEKVYIAWRRRTNACIYTHLRVKSISPEDKVVLNRWYVSNNQDKWKKAVVILGSYNKRNLKEMAGQVEQAVATLLRWIALFKESGLANILYKPMGANAAIKDEIILRKDNLLKLLHETPKLHDINRTSWTVVDLCMIYERIYNVKIATTTISNYLKQMGFGYSKSRELLTSPDPEFREKLNHIKDILSNLGPSERFFSVDELGHFSIRIRGGRTIMPFGERKVVPQQQKSKGFLIITAALELSTNQVTHFYSRTKDTGEMIKLLEVLMAQYAQATKLYFSWDKASWHASKKLYAKIEEINEDEYRKEHHNPMVELAPLPASSQFLNVIESVFSGLARSVLHNSDYESPEECMAAIDRYFKERNQHFLKNPKKAGKMIWGKELVKPVFSETNTCKYNKL